MMYSAYVLTRETLPKKLRALEEDLTVGNYFERIEQINAIRAQLKELRYESN